jgi:hypothetical protein
MKEFKIKALTPTGEKALSALLQPRDITKIIPYALKQKRAIEGTDYTIEATD